MSAAIRFMRGRRRYGKPNSEIKATDAQAAEIRRLKQELARVTEERDIFDYIEMFYNPKRKHATNGMLLANRIRATENLKLQGVYNSRGNSIQILTLLVASQR